LKLKYPSNREIAETIREVLSDPLLRPEVFVDRVKESLRQRGLQPSLVTPRRVWRLYEEMVKRKVILDVLGVVEKL